MICNLRSNELKQMLADCLHFGGKQRVPTQSIKLYHSQNLFFCVCIFIFTSIDDFYFQAISKLYTKYQIDLWQYFYTQMEETTQENQFTIQKFFMFNIYTFHFSRNETHPLIILVQDLNHRLTHKYKMNQIQLDELFFKLISQHQFCTTRLLNFLQAADVQEQFLYSYQNYRTMPIPKTNIILNAKQVLNVEQPKLETKQMKVLVTMKIITFLAEIKVENYFKDNNNQSIRHNLLEYLKKMDKLYGLAYIQRNFLAQFKIQDGHQMNNICNSVLSNQRFLDSSIKKDNQIFFNPTFLTAQSFKILTSDFESNKLLIGFGGLGKSLSKLCFTYVSNFIEQYKIEKKEIKQFDQLRALSRYLTKWELETFMAFPKVYIITLKRQGCMNSIINAIKLQTPFPMDDLTEIDKILRQIRQFYQHQKKMSVTFIVDQINVYTSIIRKYETDNKQHGQVENLTFFLQELKNNKFNIVYNSSINLQSQYVSGGNYYHNIFTSGHNTHLYPIGEYRRKFIKESYTEIIHCILFQLQIRKFDCRVIQWKSNKLRNYINFIHQELNSMNYEELPREINQIIRQVTPLNIHLFFRLQLTSVGQVSFQSIQSLVKKISNFARKRLVLGYNQFLKKGNKSIQELKYTLFLKIGARAYQLKDQPQDPKFLFCWREFKQLIPIQQFDLINKEHAVVNFQHKTIEILYSPKDFLQIASEIKQPYLSFAQLYKRHNQLKIQNESQLGFLVDRNFTRSISSQTIQLKFEENTFDLKGENDFFIHFTKNDTLQKNLKKIIQKLMHTNQKIVGAFPAKCLKKLNIFAFCHNSRVIDALIMIKQPVQQTRKLKLITFDFTTTFKISQINKKIECAKSFYHQLKSNQRGKNDYNFEDFQITHYIVLPKKLVYLKSTIRQQDFSQNFQIRLTPIEEFTIKLKTKQPNQWFYAQQLKFIEQILAKRDRQMNPTP